MSIRSNATLVTLNQGSPAFDGFGRLRIAQPETLFDSKLQYGKNELFWDEATVSGSGFTSTFLSNEAAVEIATDGTEGRFVRQTFQRFNYQPGKSQAVDMTGVFDCTGETETVFSVVRRSDTSGSPVDTVVDSADFNGNQFPGSFGTTVEEMALDLTKTQIFTIDFEWLGVGQARMGLVRNGQPYILHYFQNDNISDKVYMRTPNLPLRYEIEVTSEFVYKRIGYYDDNNGLFFQTRQPVKACKMKAICSTVISEGGQTDSGTLRYISNGTTSVSANSVGTYYALLGIRIAADELGSIVKLVRKTILCSSNDNYEWQLVYNPTIAGTPTWVQLPNSSVEYFIGSSATTITGGTATTGGYSPPSETSDAQLTNQLRIGHAIDGTPQTVVLAVTPLSTNSTMFGSLTFREEE